MSRDTETETPQPMTFGGVRNFHRAPCRTLLLYQILFAVVGALAVGVYCSQGLGPVAVALVERLPEEGQIEYGRLDWQGEPQQVLIEGGFVQVEVDLENIADPAFTADIKLELNQYEWRLCSVLGCLSAAYPTLFRIETNRAGVEAWWGAWHWPATAAGFLALVVLQVAFWNLLAALISPAGLLFGWVARREMTAAGIWKLSAAALLPGSLVLDFGVVAYGLSRFHLPELGLALLIACGVSCLFGLIAIVRLPPQGRQSRKGKRKNPFAGWGRS